jgi:hypothetical protein
LAEKPALERTEVAAGQAATSLLEGRVEPGLA